MTFAVDYDGTFSADPSTFSKIVEMLGEAGHTVVIVTQRSMEQGQVVREQIGSTVPIVWASGQAKVDATRAAGYHVDVWIDDSPESVFTPRVYVGPVPVPTAPIREQGAVRVVGVDGCRAGWFWIALEGDGIEAGIERTFAQLWSRHLHSADHILVDIPIGLRGSEGRERHCDTEARKLLGPKRGSSVFPAPCRGALLARDYRDASELNRQLSGRRLSQQSYAILNKIKEVDDVLRNSAEARSRVREIHPEILFWALSGGQPMVHRKRTRSGFEERVRVLLSFVPDVRALAARAKSQFGNQAVANDDILDALAAAVTARQGNGQWAQLPQSPERDEYGLPMEMLYLK